MDRPSIKIRFDSKLQKEIDKIKHKDPKLFKKIQKQLKQFKLNPKLKSLRVHKLSGELDNIWSISITKSIRMAYLQSGDEAYFYDLGTHDQVYREK